MTVAVGIISLILATLNSWHVLAAWLARNPNDYFTGVAHYFADYFLYIAQMREGTILSSHWFTNESMAPTWIYWFNGLIGGIGNLIGLPPFATYNIVLFLLAFGLCMLWWKLIEKIFTDTFTRVIAFIFTLTASNFPTLEAFWFSPTPAFNRLGGVPHQIFQTMLLVLLLLTYRSWLSIALSFLAATANPIQTLLIVIAILAVRPRSFFFVGIPALLGALIVNNEFATQPVLLAAKAWEAAQPVSVSVPQFLLALGPIVALIPFGLRPFFHTASPLKKIVGIYGGLAVLLFFSPMPALLGTSPVRWLSPASYALFPLIAAAALPKIKLSILPLVAFALLTIPSLFTQIQARQGAQHLNSIPQAVTEKLMSLEALPPGVILMNPSLPYDAIVPVFTRHPSFTGHPIHTLYPDVKERLRQDYFAGRMNTEQQEQFLRDHRIVHVIWELP